MFYSFLGNVSEEQSGRSTRLGVRPDEKGVLKDDEDSAYNGFEEYPPHKKLSMKKLEEIAKYQPNNGFDPLRIDSSFFSRETKNKVKIGDLPPENIGYSPAENIGHFSTSHVPGMRPGMVLPVENVGYFSESQVGRNALTNRPVGNHAQPQLVGGEPKSRGQSLSSLAGAPSLECNKSSSGTKPRELSSLSNAPSLSTDGRQKKMAKRAGGRITAAGIFGGFKSH